MSSEIKVNNPHALYYNGELVGIILNPDPLPDGMMSICEGLSPHEALADAVTIPTEGEVPVCSGTSPRKDLWAELKKVLGDLQVKDVIYPDLNFDPTIYGISPLEFPITPTNSDVIDADPGTLYYEYDGSPMIENEEQQFCYVQGEWEETTELREMCS